MPGPLLPILGAFGPPLLKSLTSGKGSVLGAVPGMTGTRKRRRKARLTQKDMLELTHIKNILGRTAAANALPFYLGRR